MDERSLKTAEPRIVSAVEAKHLLLLFDCMGAYPGMYGGTSQGDLVSPRVFIMERTVHKVSAEEQRISVLETRFYKFKSVSYTHLTLPTKRIV